MRIFLAILYIIHLIVLTINVAYAAAKRIKISWYTFVIVFVPIVNLWAFFKYRMWTFE